MGTVNCCETPKECLGNREFTEADFEQEYIKDNFDSVNDNERSLYFKNGINHSINTQEMALLKIQANVKGFVSRIKFNRLTKKLTEGIKDYFKANSVLCEVDNIDFYTNQKIKDLLADIYDRKGKFAHSSIPNDFFDTFTYKPLLSISMPCCFLVDKDKHYNRKFSESYSTYNGIDKIEKPSIYKGFWSLDKKKYGYGTLINSDGSRYEGLFRNGKASGHGRYITCNGDVFEGNFIDGSINGFGIFIHSDESIYKGYWINDQPWGKGEEWSSLASYYKGEFYKGKKHGIGEFKWKDGSVYYGGVIDDLLNGNGTYIWIDGKTYRGNWKDNEMSGKGIIENTDGTRYEGDFIKNKKHGIGRYYFNKVKYYEGEWYNGKQHGKGKIVRLDLDKIEEGIWNEGKKVE